MKLNGMENSNINSIYKFYYKIGYIPDNKKKTGSPFDKTHFTYDLDKDEYICPEGKPVSFLTEKFDKTRQKTIWIV